MAMTILNNTGTTKSLGQLNKNINAMGKVLAQSASGMKINGAADDASGYSISEKMQAQLRSLEQDVQNVRTGKNFINTAAGGIDEIIQELRNLKNLAINAANDHNSDVDRITLQKEFDQRMENIDDIASTTNYNGKLLLNGDYERWRKGWLKDDGNNGDDDPPLVDPPEELERIEPNDEPTIIDSPRTISTAGVYVLASGFTGEINIADGLVGVKIKQATADTLQNVTINGPANGNANLWIEGLNVNNTNGESWIKFSGSNNALSIKGNNKFSRPLSGNNDDNMPYISWNKADINIGDGLTVQGTGILEIHERGTNASMIGTDAGASGSANLTINSGTFIFTGADSRENTASPGGGAGAFIGSGSNARMGNIEINGGTFDIYDPGGGPGIGAGSGGKAGDIIIRNASITVQTDDGACIGSGHGGSEVNDILIESATINVESKKLFNSGVSDSLPLNNGDGAGIGSGGVNSRAGNITIRNSTVNASSNFGAGIGSGYSSHVGNIKIENSNVNAKSQRSEDDIGKGVNGTAGRVEREGDTDGGSYKEVTILGTPIVIHNGTKQNQALRCFIPNMHTKNMGLENISIITQQSAQHLLGDPHDPDVPGILDKAIDYALDAATGMGSYITELNYSEDNLVTNSENTQASESTIRDADMARTALDYAKSNILSQASQSMLAQANQNTSSVLTLLQV